MTLLLLEIHFITAQFNLVFFFSLNFFFFFFLPPSLLDVRKDTLHLGALLFPPSCGGDFFFSPTRH